MNIMTSHSVVDRLAADLAEQDFVRQAYVGF